MTDPSPAVYGQYQLIEKIAQGGMAEIFRGNALDTQGIERPVVIKRILPHIAASPEFVEMLIDEAKIAVMLSHGNIAQIYDLGKVADDYFIVMEYVEGKTLSQIMKRLRSLGRLIPISYAVSISAEIANGLDYMHRKCDERGNPLKIVHRDISPQNVILSTSGNVKIIDFGIAKAKTKVSTTDSGILKGKFAYMSPEHAEGERLDHRSDIFSLGIILCEFLTGQRLFKGKNNAETIRKVKRAKVPSPSNDRSEIPKTLNEIVLKALEKDRNNRYQSAHDLHLDLTKFLLVHDPYFSPRDLIEFLHEIFPEIAPPEKIAGEVTPSSPLRIQKEIQKKEGGSEEGGAEEGGFHEETVGADSHLIRTKLKEAEVFDIPSLRVPTPSEESSSEESSDSGTARSKRLLPRFGLVVGPVIGAVILLALAWRFYPLPLPVAPVPISPIPPVSPLPVVPPPPVIPLPPPPPPTPAAPQFGSLRIDSAPQGARIFLNDADTNRTTPALLDKIAPGEEKKLGLFLDRYKFWEGKVRVDPDQTRQVRIPLEVNYGELEVDSLPAGAEVSLNGRPSGKTPFQLARLLPDTTYDLTLNMPGYEPWVRKVKIFGGRREVVKASLKRLP